MTIVGSSEINIDEPNRLAQKLIDERYSFSKIQCPWDADYWTDAVEGEGTYYKGGIVPQDIREYRMSWLSGCSQGILFARKNKLVTMREATPASMWGVVAAAMLEGTYACIFTRDKNYLWRQNDFVSARLGIADIGLPNCTSRNIASALAKRTDIRVADRLYNREKLSGAYHSPYVYYCRVAARKAFTRDEIVKQAIYVARNVRKGTIIAEPLQRQWYEVFDHSGEIIEYFIKMGEGSMITPAVPTSKWRSI